MLAIMALAAHAALAADEPTAPVEVKDQPLIQIAVLLDTSNSMDGLIAQAKTQLWKIVNEFATARKGGKIPRLQVALYEYGNDRLPREEGHIRMVLPLTDDLDKVSEELFALTTNGGQEYCGMVIQKAAETLQWSGSSGDLKVIVIAGNEPFTQGPTDYREACKAALTKGIIVNTIHCGTSEEGVRGMWQDGAVRGEGTYSYIDQNRAVVHISAPQDAELSRLNDELNTTYVPYGAQGKEGADKQQAQDVNAASLAPSVAAQRAMAKASEQYRNARWDLLDALDAEAVKLEEIKDEDLPKEMQDMSMEQRAAYVQEQAQKRGEVQAQIQKLADERKAYVAEQMKLQAAEGEETFDEALIQSLSSQAQEKGFVIE